MTKIFFYISIGFTFLFIFLLILRISLIKRKINKNLMTRKEYKIKFKRMFIIYMLLTVLCMVLSCYFYMHDAFSTKEVIQNKKEDCLIQNKSYYKCTWNKYLNTCNCDGTEYQGVNDTMRG